MSDAATVLIVDDEPVWRETLHDCLARDGYRMLTARSGAEAITMASEYHPDIVLLDVGLPGMSGFEVCRRLREHRGLATVPVLLVTALDDRDSKLHGIEAGADDFISKPPDPLELRARVRTITSLNRFRRISAESAKFRWVVEQAPDGYLATNAHGALVYANATARRLLGLTAEGPGPHVPLTELIQREYRMEPETAWRDWPGGVVDRPEEARYLVRARTSWAPAHWLRVHELRLEEPADIAVLLRLEDVTGIMDLHRRHWEFHSAISHKLRTPLVALHTIPEWLTTVSGDLSAEERDQFVEKTRDGARRLKDEIDDILTHLSVPSLRARGESVSVAVLPEIVESCRERCGVAMARITPGIPEAADIPLSKKAMELVFFELLDNAKKFHPESNPTVDIRVERRGEHELVIAVADDGPGVPPEELSRIWTPYFQAEAELTGECPGMGLGLANVAGLVWSAGGRCRAANRADRSGAVIELAFPYVACAAPVRVSPAGTAP